MYSLIFVGLCEEIRYKKEFVDIATAGRHSKMSTFYFEHNVFHQSFLARDAELQNAHIAFFKSPFDVVEVSTLSAQVVSRIRAR